MRAGKSGPAESRCARLMESPQDAAASLMRAGKSGPAEARCARFMESPQDAAASLMRAGNSGPAGARFVESYCFPKTARILRSSDFRKVYEAGARIAGPYFAAFCLRVERDSGGPRLGFTAGRAFGRAVKRNRAKRRIREALRVRLPEMASQWDIVVNPRRLVLEASPEQLRREVDRLVSKCANS